MEDEEIIKSKIEDYTVVEMIGEGGMGTVFKADQRSISRWVAMKFLSKAYSADKKYAERFLWEARSAAQLQHPNIIEIYDIGVVEDRYFYVMEWVDGRSLDDILSANKWLRPKIVYDYMNQALQGLAYAHRLGMVHRDIKPGNLLIDDEGLLRICDFGIVKRNVFGNEDLTASGVTLGTPHYISPEQIRGEENLDGRADLYSVGATMFQMLTGQLPFTKGSSIEIMNQHLTTPVKWPQRPIVSGTIRYYVEKLLAKEKRKAL